MIASRLIVSTALIAATFAFAGCDNSEPAGTPAATPAPKSDHPHAPDGSHAPAAAPAAGHGGPVIDLGTATAGAFNLKATRDQGLIEAGKDAPIDVTVTPTAGAAKPTAVRFWIGTQDAKGSAKAKAEIENPAEPNRWHTHTEIPATIPDGAKLWVEVETGDGQKQVTSFDLKRT